SSPQPNMTTLGEGHKTSPSLVRQLTMTHVNPVWSTAIPYLPLPRGFLELVAVIDWSGAHRAHDVLTWQLSNSLAGAVCLAALPPALLCAKPDIFNTAQGVQVTAHAFTETLTAAGLQLRLNGRGRAFD